MIAKYICSYCGEEFSDIDECRTHEDECADTFKNELWIFVRGIGGMDGRAFLEKGIDFNDISIIQNKGATAFYILGEKMDEESYINPVEASQGIIKKGYYYWSDYYSRWFFNKKWNGTLARIVNTGTDIEDE